MVTKQFMDKKFLRQLEERKNAKRIEEATKKPVTGSTMSALEQESNRRRELVMFEKPKNLDDGKNAKISGWTQ